jgi:hypothetical protein
MAPLKKLAVVSHEQHHQSCAVQSVFVDAVCDHPFQLQTKERVTWKLYHQGVLVRQVCIMSNEPCLTMSELFVCVVLLEIIKQKWANTSEMLHCLSEIANLLTFIPNMVMQYLS